MVPADPGNTAPESLNPDCHLTAVFTLWFFRHRYLILEFFSLIHLYCLTGLAGGFLEGVQVSGKKLPSRDKMELQSLWE